MNNQIKKYFKKIKAYFTLKNSATVIGIILSCIAYKKLKKYFGVIIPPEVELSTFLNYYDKN